MEVEEATGLLCVRAQGLDHQVRPLTEKEKILVKACCDTPNLPMESINLDDGF